MTDCDILPQIISTPRSGRLRRRRSRSNPASPAARGAAVGSVRGTRRGRYCSEARVQQYIDGRIAVIGNPWRDGGCT